MGLIIMVVGPGPVQQAAASIENGLISTMVAQHSDKATPVQKDGVILQAGRANGIALMPGWAEDPTACIVVAIAHWRGIEVKDVEEWMGQTWEHGNAWGNELPYDASARRLRDAARERERERLEEAALMAITPSSSGASLRHACPCGCGLMLAPDMAQCPDSAVAQPTVPF